MFGSRASSAFVCLRCELQRSQARLPTLARRATQATFSTSVRRPEALGDGLPTSTPQPELSRQPPPLAERPLGRQRRKKQKLRQIIERLEGGVKTLGDDASILVLKEVEQGPSEEDNTPEVIPAAPTDAANINIVESLQLEKQPVSPSEVLQQIDSMRPPSTSDPDEPNYVSQTSYVKLSQRLLREFTSQQLSQYYSVTKGVKPKEVNQQVMEGIKELQSRTKRPQERSEWHPGTTQINLRLPGLAISRREQRKPVSKHLIVDQILRDLWKLVLLEEIEAPGELELLLKPWQLTLLTSGSDMTPLDSIGQERRVKIEIHQPDNVLRITADKSSAEYAADDIENLLQSTETQKFHLKPWVPFLDPQVAAGGLPNIISESSRNAVAAMVGAVVQFGGADHLIIRALGKGPIKEAERCLIKLLPLKEKATTTVNTYMRDATGDCYLLPAVVDPERLDYQTRSLALGRWVLPVARAQDPLPSSINEEGLDRVHNQIDAILARPDAPRLVPSWKRKTGIKEGRGRLEELEWADTPTEQLIARFGQALYPLDNPSVGDPSGSSTIFVPDQAGLAKHLAAQDLVKFTPKKFPDLDYSFTPKPEQANYHNGQGFPEITVRFSHKSHNGQYSLKWVSLSLYEHAYDVLLPGSAVDVRFSKHISLRLNRPESSAMLGEFVEAVRANLSSGEKLVAPDLIINIPKWTIPGYKHADRPGSRRVKYLFTGTSFRQSAHGSMMGEKINISMKQSGKLSASGTTLSAYYQAPGGKQDWRKHRNKLDAFLRNCFAIADDLTRAAADSKRLASIAKARRGNLWTEQSEAGAESAFAGRADAAAATNLSGQGFPEAETPSTRLTRDDMQGMSFSSFLSDEHVIDEQKEVSTFARTDVEAEEQPEDDDSLKVAA